MRKGRITFAALIIALMLITIDVGFYLLVRPAFIVLTGALASYGYVRGAMDFRNWLVKDGEDDAPIPLPEPVRHIRRNDEPVMTNRSRDPVTYGCVGDFLEQMRHVEPYTEDMSLDAIVSEYGHGEENG